MKIFYDICTIGNLDLENKPAEEIKLFCNALLDGLLLSLAKANLSKDTNK